MPGRHKRGRTAIACNTVAAACGYMKMMTAPSPSSAARDGCLQYQADGTMMEVIEHKAAG